MKDRQKKQKWIRMKIKLQYNSTTDTERKWR